jgi:hypothetical protein
MQLLCRLVTTHANDIHVKELYVLLFQRRSFMGFYIGHVALWNRKVMDIETTYHLLTAGTPNSRHAPSEASFLRCHQWQSYHHAEYCSYSVYGIAFEVGNASKYDIKNAFPTS